MLENAGNDVKKELKEKHWATPGCSLVFGLALGWATILEEALAAAATSFLAWNACCRAILKDSFDAFFFHKYFSDIGTEDHLSLWWKKERLPR